MSVLIVMQLVAAGAVVMVDGERLVCRVPTGTTLPADVAVSVRQHKDEIVAALKFAKLDETVSTIAALSVSYTHLTLPTKRIV